MTWRLHLQPVDGGWIDLAYSTPLVDPARARDELGWVARTEGPDVVRELAEGMVDRAGPQPRPRGPLGAHTAGRRPCGEARSAPGNRRDGQSIRLDAGCALRVSIGGRKPPMTIIATASPRWSQLSASLTGMKFAASSRLIDTP